MKNKLKIKDVKTCFDFKIEDMMLHYISKLSENFYGYTIDYDVYLPTKNKNLQRDFCWSLFQKQQLILSILKEINIPHLSVIQYVDERSDVKTLKIIDGKQRLSTIISFYRGEFPLEINGIEYYFNDLDDDLQRAISLFKPRVKIAYEYYDVLISDDEKIAWFEQINFGGTQQDIDHMNDLKK